ncbi:PDZ domain-containing protein [Solibacillus sp. CAU 1738]|uniref:PDZ domain-containing protein n=1 Tax=Solibacillus sp. CAU 1738 TaxID=3140363 RepID=UPI003261181B
MYSNIVIELLMAIGRFFMNPLLYIAVIFSIFLGYRRVKRERRHFNIRILDGWSELRSFLAVPVLISLVVSILSIGIGLTVPVSFLIVITLVSIVALLSYVFHFLSPIVLFAASYFFLVAMHYFDKSFHLFGYKLSGFNLMDGSIVTITLIAGLLLMAEARLIRKTGAKFASPLLEKTKRGLNVVPYFSKKLMLVPLFFIVPGDAISANLPWWPQVTLGAEQFSLVMFPFVIGFQQITRRTLPHYFYPKYGRSLMILAQLVVIGGLAAYFQPIIGAIVLAVAAIIRLIMSLVYKLQQRTDAYAVAPSSKGAMIAAVLPNSPAEKMGLVAGEVIRKVNGMEVYSESELYEALQINAAHCRLEVLDHQKEVRLTQHVVHSDDHYRIGLLLAR